MIIKKGKKYHNLIFLTLYYIYELKSFLMRQQDYHKKRLILSLIPRPSHAFHRFTQKIGKALI